MSLFKARPRVRFAGVLTYDETAEYWYVLLDPFTSILAGYDSYTSYDEEEAFFVWVRDLDNEYWASGLASWVFDIGSSTDRLIVSVTAGEQLSELATTHGVTSVVCDVGPIVRGAPFFGVIARVSEYALFNSLTYLPTADWSAIAQAPTTNFMSRAPLLNGKVLIPGDAGAFRYSVEVKVDSSTLTDGTEFSIVTYLSSTGTPEVTTFSLTDVTKVVGAVSCVKKFRAVSPILLTNDREYVRPHFHHNDTNETGLIVDIDFSVEFFAGYGLAPATDIPPAY